LRRQRTSQRKSLFLTPGEIVYFPVCQMSQANGAKHLIGNPASFKPL
jgi:hypothetical protein